MFFSEKLTLSVILLVLFGAFFYVAFWYTTGDSEVIVPSATTSAVEKEGTEKNVTPKNSEVDFVKKMKQKESTEGVEFFVEYRLERDKVRSRQIELLQQIVENPNSVAETRQEAQQKLLDITTFLEQELQLENMIIAKGYNDAVVFIQPNQVVAVINKKELTQQDVTTIADIISNTTEQKLENIIIIPKG